jgi:hypothetical protein
MISVFMNFASIVQIIYLYTVKYPETWVLTVLFRLTDSNVLQKIYTIFISKLRWQNCPCMNWKYMAQVHNLLYKNYPFHRNLNSQKFCSFRNFTNTATHPAEYLILIQLNYLNTLWNLSILVWWWRTESSFDCPAANIRKLSLALL